MATLSDFSFYRFDISFLTPSQRERVIILWHYLDRAWMAAVLMQNGIQLPSSLSSLDPKWFEHGRRILARSSALLLCMGAPRDAMYAFNMRSLRFSPLVADAMTAFLEYREVSGEDLSIPFSYSDYQEVHEYRNLMTILIGVATYESALGVLREEDLERTCKVSATECANCLTTEGKLQLCSRCGLVQYCGKACQTQHWKGSHKAQCVKKSERKPSLFANLPSVEGDACRICLESIHSAAALTTLACGHKFHAFCVEHQTACPLCRFRC